MGHMAGKDVYRALGRKVDNLTFRAPTTDTFYAFLRELYTEEEADIIVRMPYGLSTFKRLCEVTGYAEPPLLNALDRMSAKGLVVDIKVKGHYLYMPSPIVIGLFEFTMMRTGDEPGREKLYELMHRYIVEEEDFIAANFSHGERVSISRAVPYEETIGDAEYVEVLDYEKAVNIIESAKSYAIGDCSCRHAMLHTGNKTCDVPLDTCAQFGQAADFMVRNNFARKASKTEMLENLARAKELGLVLNADNVQRNVSFMCHCCSCCCHLLLGISRFGYPNTIVTSNYIAHTDESLCNGCGKCESACPINVTKMGPTEGSGKKKLPVRDLDVCIGCGVCALSCKTGALSLKSRGQRVLHPANTFERVILQCLERGTLQNQLFSEPGNITHRFMRGLVGGFLRLPPVKKALMSDALRSRFLESMKKGVARQGRAWVTRV